MLWLLFGTGMGGGIGAIARFLVQRSLEGIVDGSYWGIIVCNIVGSFLMGLLSLWISGMVGEMGETMKAFVLTGLLGGFTTFSSFSQQSFDLLLSGRVGWLFFYVAGSVILSFLMLWLGWRIGLIFWSR